MLDAGSAMAVLAERFRAKSMLIPSRVRITGTGLRAHPVHEVLRDRQCGLPCADHGGEAVVADGAQCNFETPHRLYCNQSRAVAAEPPVALR